MQVNGHAKVRALVHLLQFHPSTKDAGISWLVAQPLHLATTHPETLTMARCLRRPTSQEDPGAAVCLRVFATSIGRIAIHICTAQVGMSARSRKALHLMEA